MWRASSLATSGGKKPDPRGRRGSGGAKRIGASPAARTAGAADAKEAKADEGGKRADHACAGAIRGARHGAAEDAAVGVDIGLAVVAVARAVDVDVDVEVHVELGRERIRAGLQVPGGRQELTV